MESSLFTSLPVTNSPANRFPEVSRKVNVSSPRSGRFPDPGGGETESWGQSEWLGGDVTRIPSRDQWRPPQVATDSAKRGAIRRSLPCWSRVPLRRSVGGLLTAQTLCGACRSPPGNSSPRWSFVRSQNRRRELLPVDEVALAWLGRWAIRPMPAPWWGPRHIPTSVGAVCEHPELGSPGSRPVKLHRPPQTFREGCRLPVGENRRDHLVVRRVVAR